ncbi:MAG: hypothetical protein DMG06_05455 [Acidobacteria bacterium]|nr:MAG: hypothetical protein DMG06_05455 [Acidobacteriota bacterium]
MSRVYQAIQQAVKEGQQVSAQQPTIEDLLGLRSQEIPRPHRTETAAPQWIQANGKRSRLNLGDLTREEEMKLVQRVFLLPGPEAPRMTAFTSVEPGNGCSRVCARASEILATLVTGSVCIVDANLRSPSLHRYFGVANSRGLTEAALQFGSLQNGSLQNYVQQLPGRRLYVLPCGSFPLDHHVLLTSEGLRSVLKKLRSQFDYVLVDTPPINHYADVTLLGQCVDGIVLVMEANSTRREAARKAKDSLDAAKLHLLAAVLNKRTYPIPGFLYQKL